ncbi:MAG: hypothetical protein SPE88_03075 [Paludibacteraceae bacterium]|nr:hypothetical protein [Paludibacteraceae bacterium]
MERRYRRGFLILVALLLFISCSKDEQTTSSDHSDGADGVVVYETDSTEWRVCVVATGLLYADAVAVPIPAPYRLPKKDDAQILKTLTYPSSERFVTSDGCTFGMPSASVTKAGAKTKYSVLGLYIRKTTIDVPF